MLKIAILDDERDAIVELTLSEEEDQSNFTG